MDAAVWAWEHLDAEKKYIELFYSSTYNLIQIINSIEKYWLFTNAFQI